MDTKKHVCVELDKVNDNPSFMIEIIFEESDEVGGLDEWVLIHNLLATEEDVKDGVGGVDEVGEPYLNLGISVDFCPYCGELLAGTWH